MSEQAPQSIPSGRTAFWAILLLALVERFAAAGRAFPVPGDAAHFVQHGIALAHGNPEGMSTYWSQGMIALAALGEWLGYSPSRTLQCVSMASGVIVTAFIMLLARRLFNSRTVAGLAGVLTATNPALVYHSVTGYSEMPYAACLAAGVYVLYRWAIEPQRRWTGPALGFALLGVGAYFKATDATISAAVLLLLAAGGLLARGEARRWAVLMPASLLFALLLLPLCAFTQARSGQFTPGAKNLNIALGDYWSDSKAVYGLEKPWQEKEDFLRGHGTAAFIWKYKAELSRRWIRNSAQGVRLVTTQIFPGPFRLGPAWTLVLFAAGVILAIRQDQWRRWVWPAALAGAAPALICLCLIHARLLIPSLPFVLLLVAGICALVLESVRTRPAGRILVWSLLTVFAVRTAALGVEWADADWPAPRMARVGESLQQHGDDRDMLMCFGPVVAIHFFTNDPLRYVEFPFATIAETEAYSHGHGVTLISLSDRSRPHWPITGLFKGEAAPATWTLLEEVPFAENDAKGVPAETFRLYRRSEEVQP